MRPTAKLRRLLQEEGLLVSTTAHDALSALVLERLGFPFIFHTGYGSSATRLGLPDLGLMTMSEMVDVVAQMARATELPIIADADTGYGGLLNVARTVKELERAGAAGMIIEDQAWPKRCGHLRGKEVIGAEEQVEKLRIALEERDDPDFVIVARTDAKATHSFGEAIRRLRLYSKAGADLLFLDAPTTKEEVMEIPKALDKPAMLSLLPGGRTPLLSEEEVRRMGYKVLVWTLVPLYAATKAMLEACGRLRKGEGHRLREEVLHFDEFNSLIKLQSYERLLRKREGTRKG